MPVDNSIVFIREHPSTAENLDKLHSWGIESVIGFVRVREPYNSLHQIPPISKRLACGDVGVGAMEEAGNIADYIFAKLRSEA